MTLNKHYPVKKAPMSETLSPSTVIFPIKYLSCVLHGFAAYASLYICLEQLEDAVKKCIGKKLPAVYNPVRERIIESQLYICGQKDSCPLYSSFRFLVTLR